MEEVGIFKTENEKTLTNESVVVSFLPSKNVDSYTYEIYKDNLNIEKSKPLKIDSNFVFKENGTYYVKVYVTTKDGKMKELNSKEYVIDKIAPEIKVKSENITISGDVKKALMDNVTAKDNYDGELSNIEVNLDQVKLKNNIDNKLTYTVIDKAGNIATKDINVRLVNNSYIFAVECLIGAILLIIIYFIANLRSALKTEKRIDNYTVKAVNGNENSSAEIFLNKYRNLTSKMCKNLKKSVFITKYAKRLEKYLPVTNIHEDGFEIFAGKILVATIFVIIAVLAKFITLKMIYDYEMVLIFTIGFFALDILYFIKYKIFRIKLESDFIAAITIMNNAFKSGRSITQAIDTVSRELDGQIGKEFNRMSLELLYGLGIDVVFKRFAKRIKLEEANYLTASLTILNKTGGDIIKVFDSIERNMFDKRKLRLELASLTSGSKIVVGVLLGMPLFFILVINIINPDYFLPFFTTNIGIILLIFMLIYYIIFVVVVRKVMKVVI